mgnify:CR=1 FL=1
MSIFHPVRPLPSILITYKCILYMQRKILANPFWLIQYRRILSPILFIFTFFSSTLPLPKSNSQRRRNRLQYMTRGIEILFLLSTSPCLGIHFLNEKCPFPGRCRCTSPIYNTEILNLSLEVKIFLAWGIAGPRHRYTCESYEKGCVTVVRIHALNVSPNPQTKRITSCQKLKMLKLNYRIGNESREDPGDTRHLNLYDTSEYWESKITDELITDEVLYTPFKSHKS